MNQTCANHKQTCHLSKLVSGRWKKKTLSEVSLTLCLPVSSADDLKKQFGPRSGPTNRRA